MTARVRPGAVVSWWNGDALAFGLVRGEEKQRICLVTERGKEERVKAARVAVEVGSPGTVLGRSAEERQRAAERIRSVEARVRARAERIDVRLLWDVVSEAPAEVAANAVVDLSSLADLACGETSGEAVAALMLALIDDGIHFVRRGGDWMARTHDAVEQLQAQREKVARREKEKREFLAALAGVARGEEFVTDGTRTEQRYLEALQQLAVLEDTLPVGSRTLALEALQASGQPHDRPAEGAFRLLRKIGRFIDDDQNLQVPRYRLRTEFPPHVLSHAAHVASRGFEREGREDLTGLEVVSIDGPFTLAIDDALSVGRSEEGNWLVGIHIADPAAFIVPDDPVDEEALARGLSHYMPELRIPMLPPSISRKAASLAQDEERPALSFLVDLDAAGEIAGFRLSRSVIRSRGRLTYGAADETLARGRGPFADLLGRLDQVASLRRGARLRAGAVPIDAPDVEVHVAENGVVSLERTEAGAPSRRAVTEAMILAGELAAQFCGNAGLPVIYRRQNEPENRPEIPEEGLRDPVHVRAVKKGLRRAEAGLEAGPHFSLGLESYVQATSPLRRFQDLAVHRQIIAALAGAPPCYGHDALQRILATTEQAEANARRAEAAAAEYWLLRYLEERTGADQDAVVVETAPRTVVQLVETLWEKPMSSLTGVECGQRIRVRVERVNPRAGLLVLRPV